MLSCPGRSAALLQRCAAEPGPLDQRSTSLLGPGAQRRSATRCTASGTREANNKRRKRPLGFPSGLSCLTVAAHSHRAMSELPERGPISRSSPSSAAAAFRDSRELLPEPNAMVSHLRKMGSLSRITGTRATVARAASPLFPLSTAAWDGCARMQWRETIRVRTLLSWRASRADSRRSPSGACRWRASSRRGGRRWPCR